MMIKITKIQNVEKIKDGVGRDSKVWVLYRVTDADGDRYSTFNATPYFQAMESGAEIPLNFTEEPSTKLNPKTGQPYMNRSLIEAKGSAAPHKAAPQAGSAPKVKTGPASREYVDQSLDLLERLETKVDEILARLIPNDPNV